MTDQVFTVSEKENFLLHLMRPSCSLPCQVTTLSSLMAANVQAKSSVARSRHCCSTRQTLKLHPDRLHPVTRHLGDARGKVARRWNIEHLPSSRSTSTSLCRSPSGKSMPIINTASPLFGLWRFCFVFVLDGLNDAATWHCPQASKNRC